MASAHNFVPNWAWHFFDAVVKNILAHPDRKKGVWKLKAKALESFSPKELDKFLKEPTTKLLKQWAAQYAQSKYPTRPANDARLEQALTRLGEQVASYKRGANSRNTQTYLRAQYNKQTANEHQVQHSLKRIKKLEDELLLTRNVLEHYFCAEAMELSLAAGL